MATKETDFIILCYCGNIEACKAFCARNPDINISTGNERAFRWACSKGYLDIAKWLLEIKPSINISAKKDDAFRLACKYRYLNITSLLMHFIPYYVLNADYHKRRIELIGRVAGLWDIV